MSDLVICKEIRRVKNGYIVELRYPYGGDPSGHGKVVFHTWDDVIKALDRAKGDAPDDF